MVRVTVSYRKSTVGGETVEAFVPFPLPPSEPPLRLDGRLSEGLARAEGSLGRLAVAGQMVPSLDGFLYGFVRKEAVLTSQIEGTQATLLDLLSFEGEQTAEVPEDPHVRDVCNYLEAFDFAR